VSVEVFATMMLTIPFFSEMTQSNIKTEGNP